MASNIGFKIASGSNNQVNLKFLNQLSAGLLADFGAGGVELTELNDVITQELAADRNWVDVGLPSAVITLYDAGKADFPYLKSHFSGDVTVQILNTGLNNYHIYNCKMKPMRVGQDSGEWNPSKSIGGWSNIKLELYDMELLS